MTAQRTNVLVSLEAVDGFNNVGRVTPVFMFRFHFINKVAGNVMEQV